jgi:hypothetical protein
VKSEKTEGRFFNNYGLAWLLLDWLSIWPV